VNDTLGDVADLTGYTGASQIRDTAGGTLAGTFTVTLGTTNGYCDLTMEDNLTDAMTPGTYVYDIFITNTTTDDVQRVMAGSVTVNQRITA
jgi:hypothetical protein